MNKILTSIIVISTLQVQADDIIKKGKDLFISKSCALCHQTDDNVPCPAGDALKSPKFMGKFWGTKREVHIGIGGPVKEVVLDDEYFLESIEKPLSKIVKGSVPGMAPLPTTEDERKAIMAYIKSLSRDINKN
jgi:cytochrome c2